jgi:hypothetical protein
LGVCASDKRSVREKDSTLVELKPVPDAAVWVLEIPGAGAPCFRREVLVEIVDNRIVRDEDFELH